GPDWVALKKEGDVYALEEGVIKKGDSYKFWSEKNQVIYDLNQPTTELVPDYAAFNNIADGSPIVLKPTLYRSPKQKATAQIEGFETTAQFTTLRDTLHNRQDSIFQPSFMMKLFEATEQEGISEFEKLVVFFDSLQVQYPQFKHYILYQYNQWLPSIHPGRTQFQRARFKGAKDIDYERLYTSDLYIAFADEVIRILEEMDPTSPLIEYSPLSGLLGLLRTQHQYQAFLEKWKKPEDFIVKTAFKFAERSGRKQIKGEMLFELGRRYADLDMKEKARQYLQQSLKEDPRGWYAERGTAQKMLNNLDIIIGQPAPQFAAQTTSGDSIKLNDYKGKFLFIDFWGSWCGPCIGELPHLKDLASAFPTNEFQIIGLAEDDESRFLDYLKKNPLPYPNALAPEKVLEKWGITAFPTTYLIDPDGNILAKNLRGKNVIELVKGNMDKYKEKG
ncbi:TlpA family protein disulfide reductase, partial [candidate division KSB1 bacterium]|nr:TlpA family protein disulfide reductase [candidate division KSB1 bacterium]